MTEERSNDAVIENAEIVRVAETSRAERPPGGAPGCPPAWRSSLTVRTARCRPPTAAAPGRRTAGAPAAAAAHPPARSPACARPGGSALERSSARSLNLFFVETAVDRQNQVSSAGFELMSVAELWSLEGLFA